MDHANVKLSKTELALVTDAAFILTKNNIISKVYEMFGLLSEDLQKRVAGKRALLSPEVVAISPKIYRGEQYMGLPYVMMDYPRFYSGKDVIAVRCLFWWGNFFSITLHLSGKFVAVYETALHNWIEQHKNRDWFICDSDDAWQHHFGKDNYQPLSETGEDILNETLSGGKGFIKLAKKMPLEKWDDAVGFFTKEYGALLQIFGY